MARDAELESLAERLGSGLRAWSSVGWGDAQATRRIVLSDDRVVAARRFSGPMAIDDARRIAAVMGRLAESGLPVPRASVVGGSRVVEGSAPVAWLVTPWVEGDSGAAWLESSDRARHLAARMGELAARLATVNASGIGVDLRGGDHEMAARARGDLQTVSVDDAVRRALEPQLEVLAAQPDHPAVFAHGDFAPINVVIDGNGEVAALLDLEHARVAPPGADAAWWGWVVRHHHPDAWTAAWRTFLAAAGIDADLDEERLRALALCQLLDRAATASDLATRDRWLALLAREAAEPSANRQAT